MIEPIWEAISREAYLAYGRSTGGRDSRGDPLPGWGQLPEEIRTAWREACIAASLALQSPAYNAYTCPACGTRTRTLEEVRQHYCDHCQRFDGTDEV